MTNGSKGFSDLITAVQKRPDSIIILAIDAGSSMPLNIFTDIVLLADDLSKKVITKVVIIQKDKLQEVDLQNFAPDVEFGKGDTSLTPLLSFIKQVRTTTKVAKIMLITDGNFQIEENSPQAFPNWNLLLNKTKTNPQTIARLYQSGFALAQIKNLYDYVVSFDMGF